METTERINVVSRHERSEKFKKKANNPTEIHSETQSNHGQSDSAYDSIE